MKTLAISSVESLDTAVAEAVRLKIELTRRTALKDGEVATLEKSHQARITGLQEEIAIVEGMVLDYCVANRAALFPALKSRETSLAVFGFELTPNRVETSSRKIKWKDVVLRLVRLPWGEAYVRQPERVPDKQALLADREKLSPEQCVAAGITFCQDEQFFIRPKPETAADSIRREAP
jgi:phage host-nuclease inhibitor protein Gam